MKKRAGSFSQVVYTDGPLADLLIREDDLPPPDQLDFAEEMTRVTINLNESCVKFFKREAKRYRTPYQKIIRSVLDGYVRNATARGDKAAAKKKMETSKRSKGVKA